MSSLFIFDAEEFRPVAEVGSLFPGVESRRVGRYVELRFDDAIYIDRRATGVRHAVWYSAIAGLAGGRVTQFDKDGLRVVAA